MIQLEVELNSPAYKAAVLSITLAALWCNG